MPRERIEPALGLTLAAVVLACLTALAGLGLATCYFTRRRAPRWLITLHPLSGVAAVTCLWIVFALWEGPRALPFDAGVVVLTLVLAAGAFLFSLRATRLPVPPFVIVVHGLAALFSCALLIVGFVRVSAGPV